MFSDIAGNGFTFRGGNSVKIISVSLQVQKRGLHCRKEFAALLSKYFHFIRVYPFSEGIDV